MAVRTSRPPPRRRGLVRSGEPHGDRGGAGGKGSVGRDGEGRYVQTRLPGRTGRAPTLPERPDRAFVACTTGGAYILDITDRSRPAVTGALQYSGPLPGAAHTFVPLGSTGFAVLADETLEEGAADFPQNAWVVDARIENRPLIVGSVTPPWPEPVPAQGRFGAHNLHEYPPDRGAWCSFDIVAGAFFCLGIAVFDFTSPLRPRELGHFAPATAGEGPVTGQLNDVFIDDRGVIYAVDRRTDLCYMLEIESA